MKKYLTLFLLFLVVILSQAQVCDCSSGGCNITSTLQYNGNSATGNYSVRLAPGHTTIINPLIIVEGLDFQNTSDCNDYLYNSTISSILSNGYDIIYLDFDDNFVNIKLNALLLIELLTTVNQNYHSGNIVLGVNTGAIMARYALTYMEENGLDHKTKLYVSYDGPHQGLNLPFSLQRHLYNYTNPPINLFAQELENKFASVLMNQLKIHGSGFADGINNSDAFFEELNQMNDCNGYPKKCRKIAISGGSGLGEVQKDTDNLPAEDGMKMFFYFRSAGQTSVSGHSSTVPSIWPGNGITSITIEHLAWILNSASTSLDSADVVNQKPYDISPGSYNRDIVRAVKSLATTLNVPYSGINDFFENATFIPTVSALDINTEDLFYDLSTVTSIESFSPFDDVFYQTQNFEFGKLSPLANALSFINSNLTLANDYSDCDEGIINVSFNVLSNQYKESHSKISTQIVAEMFNGSESDFKSNGEVILKPGFYSRNGSDFLARIKTCEIQLCEPPILYKKENGYFNRLIYSKAEEGNSMVTLYPNPTNGILTVSSDKQILKIKIMNSIGTVVKVVEFTGHKLQIDVSKLSKGTYYLTTYLSDDIIVKKLIKL